MMVTLLGTADVPQGRAEVRQPWGAVGMDADQAGGQVAASGQQDVARTTGRVQDEKLEERCSGADGRHFDALQNGVKGAVRQHLNRCPLCSRSPWFGAGCLSVR